MNSEVRRVDGSKRGVGRYLAGPAAFPAWNLGGGTARSP